ncbi:MAG: DUF192 domain-containing protein [Acidobacteriia bacterium]|nr:DUF192 domain-containing protein [Terriglobia bacterium]
MRAVNTTRGTVLGDRVRVADGSLTRLVGLLGERELAPGDGLLILPSQGVHTWGMRFAIDVVVLDDDWRALALRPAMPPWRMTRLFFKSSAVLELPSGVIRSTSTSVGDVLDFSRVAATGS